MCADRHKELKLAELTCWVAKERLVEMSRDARELDISVGREWKVKADKSLESVIIQKLQKEKFVYNSLSHLQLHLQIVYLLILQAF